MDSVQNTIPHNDNCANGRGAKVLVRIHGGALVERRLWAVGMDIAFVCTEEIFNGLREGMAGPPATAFSLSDVINPATGRNLAHGHQ